MCVPFHWWRHLAGPRQNTARRKSYQLSPPNPWPLWLLMLSANPPSLCRNCGSFKIETFCVLITKAKWQTEIEVLNDFVMCRPDQKTMNMMTMLMMIMMTKLMVQMMLMMTMTKRRMLNADVGGALSWELMLSLCCTESKQTNNAHDDNVSSYNVILRIHPM